MAERVISSYITVTSGLSGYFAIEIVRVLDEWGEHEDIYQSGIGRYKHREDAVAEAVDWARSEGIQFKE